MKATVTNESSAQYNPDFDRLPAGFKALIEERFALAQQALAAAAGRGAGAAVRNKAEGEAYRAPIAKAAALVPLHAIKPCHRAREVQKVIRLYGPAHFGLEQQPDRKTVQRAVDEIIDEK